MIPGGCAASVQFGVGAPKYAVPCTWQRWWLYVTTLCSKPITSTCWRQASARRSPPAHASEAQHPQLGGPCAVAAGLGRERTKHETVSNPAQPAPMLAHKLIRIREARNNRLFLYAGRLHSQPCMISRSFLRVSLSA